MVDELRLGVPNGFVSVHLVSQVAPDDIVLIRYSVGLEPVEVNVSAGFHVKTVEFQKSHQPTP